MLRARFAVHPMVEHFLGQDNAGLAVRDEEAVPVNQGDASDGNGLDRPRRLPGNVGRNILRGELDDAEPLWNRQTANGQDELLDGHERQHATRAGPDASPRRGSAPPAAVLTARPLTAEQLAEVEKAVPRGAVAGTAIRPRT